jgi:photosystem II stability/assembly factor-like uncharacterized protein
MAAVGSWSPLGPDGGSIYALAADPANPKLVYAATPTSVFRSGDGGDSWTFVGGNLGSSSAPGLRALALSGTAVIAGTSWEGVWRSLDEGRTWRATTAGLPIRPHVNTLLADPRRPERVWLASWEGIFVSEDRGETWTARNGGLLAAGGVESLAIDPANGQLYARTVSELFTSSDEGTSWSLLRCLGRRCGSVAVDPADAGTLVTITGGVLRSRDGGTVWEKLRVPKGGLYALLGFHGGRLFAYSRSYANGLAVDRLYWSADQGASWTAAGGQPEAHSIAVMASSGDTLYLGSAGLDSLGGVFRSGDGGEHWEAASRGLSGRWIESIAVDPQQPGVLYAQASDHLLASEDDGASWRLSLAAPNVLVFGAGDLLVDPHLRGRVWSTTGDSLSRSDDGGHRWTAVRIGAGIEALAADPRTGGGVWAGGRNGLFHSSNGRAWKMVRPARDENLGVVDVAVAPGDPRLVWVAGYASTAAGAPLGPRLYRSGDGGQSWQQREDGLPDPVTHLALDPERPDVLFAAAGDGLFGSSDGGSSWRRLPSPATVSASPESIRWEIVASPVPPLTLYANLDGIDDDVVYRSRDAGATWQAVGGGGIAPGSFGIRALAVDPHDPRRLLAGTAKRGIFTFTEP